MTLEATITNQQEVQQLVATRYQEQIDIYLTQYV